MVSDMVAMSRRALLAGLVTAFAIHAAPAFARTDAAASPKAFLEAIYKAYVGPSDQAKGIPLASAGTVKRYFSPGLASLILDDDAAAKQRKEPAALDGDPFVGRQDWQISDLAIEVKEGPVKATGTVSFNNGGKPEKVLVELLKVGSDWRIADIRWDSGTLRDLYRQK